jgi:hypothetical protein
MKRRLPLVDIPGDTDVVRADVSSKKADSDTLRQCWKAPLSKFSDFRRMSERSVVANGGDSSLRRKSPCRDRPMMSVSHD